MTPAEHWQWWQQHAPDIAKVTLDRAIRLHTENPADPGYWWVRPALAPEARPPWFPDTWHFSPNWDYLFDHACNSTGILPQPVQPHLWVIRELVRGSLLWNRTGWMLSGPRALALCNAYAFLAGLPPAYRLLSGNRVREQAETGGFCLAPAADQHWIHRELHAQLPTYHHSQASPTYSFALTQPEWSAAVNPTVLVQFPSVGPTTTAVDTSIFFPALLIFSTTTQFKESTPHAILF